MNILLLLFALPGHAFLWIGLINRYHGLGIRRKIIKRVTLAIFACAALIPIYIGWRYVSSLELPTTASWGGAVIDDNFSSPINAYLVLCWVLGPATILRLAYVRFQYRLPPLVRFHGVRRAEIDWHSAAANAEERAHHILTRLPLNESLQLDVSEWMLDVPRLPPTLDGLSIVHLSDLHFTGRVGKAYFREVVRVCNERQPDLVCITGDIIDRRRCFDWIADTLGRLTARHGVYYILGNHDIEVETDRLRRTMNQCGLIDLGGRCASIEIKDAPVFLAGSERPWFNDSVECAQRNAPYGLRIVLSHSPDQFAWARKQDADLMLAGHTHGGQIRIPPLGAIFSPSVEGVKYISGVYYVPPTILHVSRGLSGDFPVRWNCRPEIVHLRLRTCGTTTLTSS
jgi:uncharacterized protein